MRSGIDGGAEEGLQILTPDQRVRVFVSSTLRELAAERAAARTAITRLSVFTGSWTVEASDAVGTVEGDLDAVDTLASLLAQSLIMIDESDPAEPRFRMLNTPITPGR